MFEWFRTLFVSTRERLTLSDARVATLKSMMSVSDLDTLVTRMLLGSVALLLCYLLVAFGKDTNPLDLLGKTWSPLQWAFVLLLPAMWIGLWMLPQRNRFAAIGVAIAITLVLGYQLLSPRTLRIQQSLPPANSPLWLGLEWGLGLAGALFATSTVVTVLRFQTDELSTPIAMLLMLPCQLRDAGVFLLRDVSQTPWRTTGVMLAASVGTLAAFAWLRANRASHAVTSGVSDVRSVVADSAVPGRATIIDREERSLARPRTTAVSLVRLGNLVRSSGEWAFEATWFFTSRTMRGDAPQRVAALHCPMLEALSVWFDPTTNAFSLRTYATDDRAIALPFVRQRLTTLLVQFQSTEVRVLLDEQLVESVPWSGRARSLNEELSEWTWELGGHAFGTVRSVQAYVSGTVVLARGTAAT